MNLTICIEDLNKKIDRDCVAIIPVHYGGSACRMEEIMELAKKNNLKVIEDCAHTQGGLYKEKLLGTFGDIGCFSFEEKKGMTTGDGGMLCSNNKNIIDHLRPMRWVGIDKDTWRRAKDFETSKENSRHWFYEIRNLGFKYNMNNMAASLGISQLKKLDKINNSKNNSIHTYLNNLKGHKDYKLLMDYTTNFTGSYWLFGIRTSRRSELIEFLQTKGVSTGVHFTPLNEQPYFQNFPGETPRAKALYSDILTLPLYPVMEEGSVEYVCEMVNNFFI